MRKDIHVNVESNDVVFTNQKVQNIYELEWLSEQQDDYALAEITMPSTVLEQNVIKNGLYSRAVYLPKTNKVKVRFKIQNSETSFSYIINPKTDDEWFVLWSGLYGTEQVEIRASELMLISTEFWFFYINIDKGIAEVYGGLEKDFSIINANQQNANMLLKCDAGNNYRYPLMGVGLTKWINSNMSSYLLTKRLSNEFIADGVVVKNAKYDFSTGKLLLDLDTTNVDRE